MSGLLGRLSWNAKPFDDVIVDPSMTRSLAAVAAGMGRPARSSRSRC